MMSNRRCDWDIIKGASASASDDRRIKTRGARVKFGRHTMLFFHRSRARLVQLAVLGLTSLPVVAPFGCADPQYAPARNRRDASARYAVESQRSVENDFEPSLAYLNDTNRRIIGERERFGKELEATVQSIQSRRKERFSDQQLVPSNFSQALFFREMSINPEDFARLVY